MAAKKTNMSTASAAPKAATAKSPKPTDANKDAYIHIRCTEDDKERFADISARRGFRTPGKMHRVAPSVLDAAYEVVEQIVDVATRRALTAVENNALRLLDPIRFADANAGGPLTDPPETRRTK